jgi:large subunit ribosomal protein L9
MKVILLEDVYKQGVAGDLVDVAPGYARNFLIPRGMAVKVSPGALRQFENLRKTASVRREQQVHENEKLAGQLAGLTFYFGVKAGETGKLYGSVTSMEIAEQIKEQTSLEIDHRRIGDRPLRELGSFQVPVRLDAGLTATVKVVIHREGVDPHEAEAAFAAEAAAEAAARAEAEAEYVEVEEEEEMAEAEAEAEVETETEAEAEDTVE